MKANPDFDHGNPESGGVLGGGGEGLSTEAGGTALERLLVNVCQFCCFVIGPVSAAEVFASHAEEHSSCYWCHAKQDSTESCRNTHFFFSVDSGVWCVTHVDLGQALQMPYPEYTTCCNGSNADAMLLHPQLEKCLFIKSLVFVFHPPHEICGTFE